MWKSRAQSLRSHAASQPDRENMNRDGGTCLWYGRGGNLMTEVSEFVYSQSITGKYELVLN